MSFFRREAEPARVVGDPVSRSEPKATVETRVARGTRIEGLVGGTSPVVVEGELQGQVRLDSLLTVRPGGKVAGSVEADLVRVEGSIEGDVRARERFELASGGSLIGDVSAPKVVIAEGAYFKGQVEMKGGAAAEPPAAQVSGAREAR